MFAHRSPIWPAPVRDAQLMPSPIGQQPASSQAPGLAFNAAGNGTAASNNNNTDSLASNNPFRNYRATSPGLIDVSSFPTTPTSPFDDPMPSQRPLSRNPFLDQPPAPRPADAAAAGGPKTQSLTAEEIFVRLP